MAKVSGPLFSIAAHGSIGGAVTYSQRSTHNHARFQKKQKDYVSPARATQRELFSTTNGWWDLLTPEEQAGFAGYDELDE